MVIEVVLYILGPVFVIMGVIYLYWFARLVRAVEQRAELQPTSWLSRQAPSSIGQEPAPARPVRVPELAPESIAPHLRRPPKSAGFGPNTNS